MATLTRFERRAWAAGLALFVGGDMATTAIGLQLGAVESNPAGAGLISTLGLWPAMLVGKAASASLFGAAWAMWSLWVGAADRVVIPILMAWTGGIVMAINGHVILVALGVL